MMKAHGYEAFLGDGAVDPTPFTAGVKLTTGDLFFISRNELASL